MKTPKRVLTAIEKYNRRIEKVLENVKNGKRLRGQSRFQCLDEVLSAVKITKLLEQNKLKTAVDVWGRSMIGFSLPILIEDYILNHLNDYEEENGK